jgi:Polyketide cyclase / dehydrase and lipid transport
VDVTAGLDAPVEPARLFAWVDDLDRYPAWLDIVPRAERAAAADGDAGPAWVVDLRGRLGPFARSKRLRMVRTEHAPPSSVAFERRETDGRSHSPWVLRAEVEEAGGGSRLTVHLHYGGGLWAPVLERLLGDAIERSRARLLERATAG